jgi:hypothetical protein
MKHRITLTIDPAVVKSAKKTARARKTSVSGPVEMLLRAVSVSADVEKGSFVDRWAGKFDAAEASPDDARMKFLRAKHRL